jgi:uncharacterized lipoprotein YddW (UPF0748 family)
MDKRTFIKNTALATAGIMLGNQLTSCKIPQSPPKKHKNWVWAHPHVNWSADTWKMKVDKALDAGINAMLVEVYNGTNTFYEGGQLPMVANVLEKIIPICQTSGMELHAWMWTMPCNAPQIVEKHPEWYAYNGLGQPAHTHPAYVSYYKFLCPCHPGAQEFITGNVTALSKISELAGVHLDYVRLPDVIIAEGLQPKYNIVQDKEYPPYDYSYSPSCRELFKAKHGIDPLTDIKEPASHKEWVQFRRDSITHLVNDILVPEAKKYNKQVTAAVFPNWENVRQEWHRWNLDGFLPMLYHNFYLRDMDYIAEHTQKANERLNHKKPVYSGLFIPSIKADQISEAVAEAQKGKCAGVSLFDLASMSDEHWQALKKVLKG